MKQSRRWLAAAVSLAAVAGCQSVVPSSGLRQAAFSLGQEDTAIATAGQPVAVQTGELMVNFQSALNGLKRRRILSTLADVDHVVVTVTPATGSPVSKTVAKAAIVAGQTTAAFTGLAAGAVTVRVDVFDASNTSLASTTGTSSVVVGQVATVDLFVQLAPTIVSTGGGGASSPTTGDLNANVFLQEGAVIQNLPGGGTFETYKMPFKPIRVAVTSTGAAWVSGTGGAALSYLARLSPTGTLEKVIQSTTYQFNEVFVSPDDHVWAFTTGSTMSEYDDDGVLLHTYPQPGQSATESPAFDGVDTFAMGTAGISPHIELSKVGVSAATPLAAADTGIRLKFGKNNDIWSTGNAAAYDLVVRVSRDGAQLSKVSLGADYYSAYTAVDAQGNGWVTGYKYTVGIGLNSGKVFKFSPTGQLLGSTALPSANSPQGIYFEPSGRMWVLNNAGVPSAIWLDANGVEKGHVDLPDLDLAWFGAAGVSGAWALSTSTSSVYRIAPAAN